MSTDFEQIEQDVEHTLGALADRIDAPPPREVWVAAVKSAVTDEARRWRRRRRLHGVLRPAVGIAAAVVLAIGVQLPGRPDTTLDLRAPAGDPDAAVAAWLGALEDSGDRLTALVDQDAFLDAQGNGGDSGSREADPLRLIEESLDHFESMIGA